MAAKKAQKTTKITESKEKVPNGRVTSTMAKSGDGTIQITFTIPYKIVEDKRQSVLEEIGKDIQVPGFRKGKAPISKVAEHTSNDTVIQKTLSQILPEALGQVIRKENLKPAIYPKFELIKATENESWEVRATTCELPDVTLGEYKKELKGASKASAIWTPEKGKPTDEKPKEASRVEMEQQAIKTLLSHVKIVIPKLLVEEETNSKLSQLLERIEKLGLNLDSYLASIGKNVQSLRSEYEEQSRSSILLDLILTQIAIDEKIKVDESEIDAAIKASAADPALAQKTENEQQKRLIESILVKRKALDFAVSLL